MKFKIKFFIFCLMCLTYCNAFASQPIIDKEIPDSLVFEKLDKPDKIEFKFKDKTVGSKLKIVIFWASWCGQCAKIVRHVQPVYSAFKDQIQLIAINVDKDKRGSKSRKSILFRFVMDQFWLEKPKDPMQYYPRVLPTTVLFNTLGELDTYIEGTQNDKMYYFKKRVTHLLEK